MNGPENDLNSTLQRKADEFARRGGHDLDLAQVVSRAGEIRRGRRMRASMAMAAVVLAVAVPVGITVIGNDPAGPRPLGPAATGTPAPATDASPISLGDLDTGPAPQRGFARDGRLQPGDVDSSARDGAQVAELARVGDDFLVGLRNDAGDLVARFVAEDGVVGADRPASYGFGVSASGRTAAVVQPDGTVVAYQDRGTKQVEVGRVPTDPGASVVGITGDDCASGGSCTVYVQSNGADPAVWTVSPGSDPRRAHPGILRASGVTPDGIVVGQVSATDDGSCSEVRARDDSVLDQTCAFGFGAVSPDGTRVLARDAYGDGLGDGRLAVLDLKSQQVLLDLRTAGTATVVATTWEDDAHVLALVLEENTWAVLRFDLQGNREYALAPVAGTDDVTPPFLLAR